MAECGRWFKPHKWSNWRLTRTAQILTYMPENFLTACQIRRCQSCGLTEVRDVGNRQYALLPDETPAPAQEAGGPQSTGEQSECL